MNKTLPQEIIQHCVRLLATQARQAGHHAGNTQHTLKASLPLSILERHYAAYQGFACSKEAHFTAAQVRPGQARPGQHSTARVYSHIPARVIAVLPVRLVSQSVSGPAAVMWQSLWLIGLVKLWPTMLTMSTRHTGLQRGHHSTPLLLHPLCHTACRMLLPLQYVNSIFLLQGTFRPWWKPMLCRM